MTEKTPPEDAGLDAEIEQVRRTMTYLTKLLALMEDEVMEGEPGAIKEAAKLLGEIRNWSKLAMETEARFEEREKRREGVVNGYATQALALIPGSGEYGRGCDGAARGVAALDGAVWV